MLLDTPERIVLRAGFCARPRGGPREKARLSSWTSCLAVPSQQHGCSLRLGIDHHLGNPTARLGPVKALRFASPRARAAGLDRASIEPLLGSYVMVAVLCRHTLATLR